ncbi:SH3 domain-containing kinase-binding protein 1 isoform X3 [Amia ocellicauda]|uniref:SH3 domain-containing kinase-binding protein 1 isoform X3 n=1 Tax=Amia ocellicauda TaxID=2972642 RepID=UPI003463EF97
MVEAIVEFDYRAQHDDELTITVGSVITNIRKDDGGWWEGEVNGRRGFFPDNFVREIKKDVKKEPQAQKQKAELSNGSPSPAAEPSLRPPKKGEGIRKRRCKAAFSYMPQNEDELELKIGDIIEVLGEVEEGWWEGTLNGKTGMFPSNFIKELPPEREDPPTPQEDSKSTRTSQKDSTGSESDGGDSSSARSEGGSVSSATEIQPKKIKGFGFGDIFKDQPIKLRPRSMDLDSELSLPNRQQVAKKMPPGCLPQETAKTEPESKAKVKEYCKVIFPYEAQNEDELSIKEGEIVVIISKECADAGWWMGELNGKQGVFPDNFVKLLAPDVEKERPKKPPPPAAPTGKQSTDKKTDVRKVPPERPEFLPLRVEDKDEKPEKDTKAADIPRPALPAVPPKKPLPPKTNSLGRPAALPPKRPERPAVPSIRCESPKTDGGGTTTADRGSSDRVNDIGEKPGRPSALQVDIEDFDSIVSTAERLNHPTTTRPRVTDRRPRSQIFTSSSLSSPDLLDSLSPEDERREKEEQDSASPKAPDTARKAPKPVPGPPGLESKSPPPPKPGAPPSSSSGPSPPPSSSSLHPGGPAPGPGPRPASPSPFAPDTKPKNDLAGQAGPPTMEELRTQLRDLRGVIELMKSQHKKEIKQLMNELDEEKKVRLSLQMEVEHIKKVLHSK